MKNIYVHSKLSKTSRNLRLGPVVASESPFGIYRIWPKSGFIWGQILQIHPTKLANALPRSFSRVLEKVFGSPTTASTFLDEDFAYSK